MNDDGQDAGGWMQRTLAALGRRWRWRGGRPLADEALDAQMDGTLDAKLDQRYGEAFDRRMDRKLDRIDTSFPPYRVETDGGADEAGLKDDAGQP
jgi:hypothetical protein